LKWAKEEGIYLLHFERSQKSFWGGYIPRKSDDEVAFVGQNELGKLMMKIGQTLGTPKRSRDVVEREDLLEKKLKV
jgi:hypothetical protein